MLSPKRNRLSKHKTAVFGAKNPTIGALKHQIADRKLGDSKKINFRQNQNPKHFLKRIRGQRVSTQIVLYRKEGFGRKALYFGQNHRRNKARK